MERHAAPQSAPATRTAPATQTAAETQPSPETQPADHVRDTIGPPSDPGLRAIYSFFPFLDSEEQIFRSGSAREIILLRSAYFGLVVLVASGTIFFWRCLAMMLLGVVLIRRGVFDHPEEHRGLFIRFLVLGLLIGVPVQVAGMYLERIAHGHAFVVLISTYLFYFGSLGVGLAYLGGLALLCLNPARRKILEPLAPVGRMALTNYIGQSVICNLLFYSYGLGWFGKVPYVALVAIAFAIFIVQIVVSGLWLRVFRFGPLEWVWRSLTYLRIQPVLRAPNRESSSAAT
jgi:uncharacterized protein